MTREIFAFLAAAAILLAGVAFLPRGGGAEQANIYTAATALNGKSFVLDNGETVRLAGLQAPNVAETSGKMRAGEPMGEAAREALADLVQGKRMRLEYGPQPRDRHGRHVAFVYLEDGRPVQEEMIKAGWALVYGFPDNRERLPRLLPLEEEARRAGRGIWADPYWQPQPAEKVRADGERYLLAEGVLQSAKQVRGNWYLNFGADWKTDFTAMIRKEDYRAYFAKRDLSALEGEKLRLRGWVYRYNGPMMDIAIPEQIEIMER